MTFLGQPRTPLAEHAHESNRYMTLPLVLLSIFAIGAGWFGIPEDFPVLGPMINNNWFHHFVGATVEHTLAELHELELVAHALETLEFNPVPLIASVVVALGGIFVGWWIYGRNPLQQEEKDPLITSLGPLHTFLENKWYWDELYQTLFIGPTVRFSERVVYEIVDKGLIDGILHLVARVVYRLGRMMKSFEDHVIGGGVDWLKDQLLAIAYEFRQLQTGKVQEYTLVSMLIASALALVVLAINYGWLQPLFEIFNNL